MWPHERSLVKHLAGKPFAVIGVNISEARAADLKKVMDKEQREYVLRKQLKRVRISDILGRD